MSVAALSERARTDRSRDNHLADDKNTAVVALVDKSVFLDTLEGTNVHGPHHRSADTMPKKTSNRTQQQQRYQDDSDGEAQQGNNAPLYMPPARHGLGNNAGGSRLAPWQMRNYSWLPPAATDNAPVRNNNNSNPSSNGYKKNTSNRHATTSNNSVDVNDDNKNDDNYNDNNDDSEINTAIHDNGRDRSRHRVDTSKTNTTNARHDRGIGAKSSNRPRHHHNSDDTVDANYDTSQQQEEADNFQAQHHSRRHIDTDFTSRDARRVAMARSMLRTDSIAARECVHSTALRELADHGPIEVRPASKEFPVYRVFNAASVAECAEIISIAQPRFAPSTQIRGDVSTTDSVRTSYTAYLDTADHRVLRRVARRLASLVGAPLDSVEQINVVRYRYGEGYMFHHDFLNPETDRTFLKNGGQRVLTFFLYLNDVDEGSGGETYFPAIDLRVQPECGTAVFWPNTSEDGTQTFGSTLHAGMPITKKGTVKYGMNVWITLPDPNQNEDPTYKDRDVHKNQDKEHQHHELYDSQDDAHDNHPRTERRDKRIISGSRGQVKHTPSDKHRSRQHDKHAPNMYINNDDEYDYNDAWNNDRQ